MSLLLACIDCVPTRKPLAIADVEDHGAPIYVRLSPEQYPEFNDRYGSESLYQAIDNQLAWLRKHGKGHRWMVGGRALDRGAMVHTLRAFRDLYRQRQYSIGSKCLNT